MCKSIGIMVNLFLQKNKSAKNEHLHEDAMFIWTADEEPNY